MIFGFADLCFMSTSGDKGWKQRPDEEGIATLTVI